MVAFFHISSANDLFNFWIIADQFLKSISLLFEIHTAIISHMSIHQIPDNILVIVFSLNTTAKFCMASWKPQPLTSHFIKVLKHRLSRWTGTIANTYRQKTLLYY